MKFRIKEFFKLSCLLLFACNCSCKKLVNVPEPINTLTTVETFSSDANANSAIAGIYNDLISGNTQSYDYANCLTTFYAGISADELIYFDQTNTAVVQIATNNIQAANNPYVGSNLWIPGYFDIYMANAAIEGLQASNTLTPAKKNQFLGEAYFLRAYVYFYMVNLFGNIPLVTSTDYAHNATLSNSTPTQIYQQIISDLKAAQGLLISDYSFSNGERVRANKWAATALLARAYLYINDFSDAATQASSVINNTGTYSLVTDLNSVFLANSNEAIWQLIPNQSSYWAVPEAYVNLLYIQQAGQPQYYLTNTLLNAFEPNDQRAAKWVDTVTFSGTLYYYPYKYKVPQGSQGSITEYYMMLRLAEQYLIRAEAEANGATGGTAAAIIDLNIIRNRAGLPNYSGATDKTSVLTAIYHERQVELFAEWGHRWFDLIRAKQVTTVLSQEKGYTINNNSVLYPIPLGELQTDPNLKQNPGY